MISITRLARAVEQACARLELELVDFRIAPVTTPNGIVRIDWSCDAQIDDTVHQTSSGAVEWAAELTRRDARIIERHLVPSVERVLRDDWSWRSALLQVTR